MFISGCIQQKEYVCSDGTTVTSPDKCTKTEISQSNLTFVEKDQKCVDWMAISYNCYQRYTEKGVCEEYYVDKWINEYKLTDDQLTEMLDYCSKKYENMLILPPHNCGCTKFNEEFYSPAVPNDKIEQWISEHYDKDSACTNYCISGKWNF